MISYLQNSIEDSRETISTTLKITKRNLMEDFSEEEPTERIVYEIAYQKKDPRSVALRLSVSLTKIKKIMKSYYKNLKNIKLDNRKFLGKSRKMGPRALEFAEAY